MTGLFHLCNVASGADDTDSIDFEEYNVIVDVVEPSLPTSMRVTLFHVFCENALKKEGKKWESEALAMTLLEHNLPLERLNDVYVAPIKKLKSLLEQKHNAVASSARGLVDDLIINIVEEEETEVIRELEKRIFQIAQLKKEAMQDNEADKNKVDAAFLACVFLETEIKNVARKLNEGGTTGGGGRSFGSASLAKAVSMNRMVLMKGRFNHWKNVVTDEVAKKRLYSHT